MEYQILIFTVLLSLTVSFFICGFISVIIMQVKSYKIRSSLKNYGYPVENMKGVILPASNQISNIKDSYGKSIFSFENYMTMSFGKGVFDVKDASIQASISALKKNYKIFTSLLTLAVLFLIISIITLSILGNTF